MCCEGRPAVARRAPFPSNLPEELREPWLAMAAEDPIVCDHSRRLMQVMRLPPGCPAQTAYYGCYENERYAILNRHVVDVGSYSKRAVKLMWRVMRSVLPTTTVTRWSEQQFVDHCKGAKRRRYANAFASLRVLGLNDDDARIRAFIKFEKSDRSKAAVKAPRLIQYRDPRFCGTLGCYLAPLERMLFGRWNLRDGVEHAVFSKGLDSYQIAKRIVHMDRFADTVFVLADAKNFDSHMVYQWRQLLHRYYLQSCRGGAELRWLLRKQLVNYGLTANGVKYSCQARMMSGEYDTSLGDTLVNYTLLKAWLGTVDHEILINGDDSVIAVSRSDLPKLELPYAYSRHAKYKLPMVDWFQLHAFEVVVEMVEGLESVEFCQAHPVQVRPGVWRMVRKPIRALSRMSYSIHNYAGESWLRYLTAVGLAELALSDGVPVLQAAAQRCLTYGRGKKPIDLPDYHPGQLERGYGCAKPQQITAQARASFAVAFDMSPTEQINLENWLLRDDGSFLEGLSSKRIESVFKINLFGLRRGWRPKHNAREDACEEDEPE